MNDPFTLPDLPSVPLLQPPEQAVSLQVYLQLLADSEDRAVELRQIQRIVTELKVKAVQAQEDWRDELEKKSSALMVARDREHAMRTRLIITARAVCPILREYLLFCGQLPLATGTPTFEDNQRNAREMLVHLELFEKM